MRTLLMTIIFVSCNLAGAAETRYADWTFIDDVTGYKIAKTTNAAGVTTGVICNSTKGECYAYITSLSACDNGATLLALINAKSTVLACDVLIEATKKDAGLFLSKIEDTHNAMSAFQNGVEVEFAIPQQSGKSQVYRFSTNGATAAIERASRVAAVGR
jgi:hypothetical protein